MVEERKGESVKAGDWVIWRNWDLQCRQIEKVTPKLFKLCRGGYPSQIERGARQIVCVISAPDVEAVRQVRDSIAGAEGEFDRRKKSAGKDYNERVQQAIDARDQAVARIIARLSPNPQPTGEDA